MPLTTIRPPVTTPETRLASSDQYGPIWADAQGYLYRAKPNAAFDQSYDLSQWEDMDFVYRSRSPDPSTAALFPSLASGATQVQTSAGNPAGDSLSSGLESAGAAGVSQAMSSVTPLAIGAAGWVLGFPVIGWLGVGWFMLNQLETLSARK